jgi:hypothetical protein
VPDDAEVRPSKQSVTITTTPTTARRLRDASADPEAEYENSMHSSDSTDDSYSSLGGSKRKRGCSTSSGKDFTVDFMRQDRTGIATLRELILIPEGLDAFMVHCSEERAIEPMTAMIEIVQWKKMMSSDSSFMYTVYRRRERRTGSFVDLAELEFPDSTPRSSIVWSDYTEKMQAFFSDPEMKVLHERSSTSSLRFGAGFTTAPAGLSLRKEASMRSTSAKLKILTYKHVAYLLWMKYSKGPCEINISFTMRRALDALLQDYDCWMTVRKLSNRKLYFLFDEVVFALLKMMNAHFLRFSRKL